MTADVKNPNLQISDTLRELDCTDESELAAIRETLKHNSVVAEKLKSKNSELAAETENEKIQYNEVSENIASEDAEAVHDERQSIRSGIAAKAARRLQAAYGRRYSGEVLREVENEVDVELGDVVGKQSLLESCGGNMRCRRNARVCGVRRRGEYQNIIRQRTKYSMLPYDIANKI